MKQWADAETERIVADATGGVVFDHAWTPTLDRAWFAPQHWHQGGAAQALAGGRGGVWLVDTPVGRAVLRHYRRGGLVARVARDGFVWLGQARVRSLREYQLLSHLFRLGLPVPRPLGGAWARRGLLYRADLLTAHLPGTHSLASALPGVLGKPELAEAVGETLGRFHAHGAFHADLNAHNILIDGAGCISVIDFDRGGMRQPQWAWQRANLERLLRSLRKLGAGAAGGGADLASWWQVLLRAHGRVAGA